MSVPKHTASTPETRPTGNMKKIVKKIASGNEGGSCKLMPPRRTRLSKMTPRDPPPNRKPIPQASLSQLQYKESANKKFVVKKKSFPRPKKTTSTSFNWPSHVYGGFTSYSHSTHSQDANRVINGGNQSQLVNFGDHATTTGSTSTHYGPDGTVQAIDDDGDHHMEDAADDEGM